MFRRRLVRAPRAAGDILGPGMEDTDQEALREAVRRIETNTFSKRFMDITGVAVDYVLARLPSWAHVMIGGAAKKATDKGMDFALDSLHGPGRLLLDERAYRILCGLTGAAGGAAG